MLKAELGLVAVRVRAQSSSSSSPPLRRPNTEWRPHRINPPSSPGCSKWFSCSCCRRSSGPSQEPEYAQTSDRPKSIPHLPLPPPLPYSPTSLPFLRHLQILELALLSTPKESWDVYWSLHGSLRRYIPDHVFRNLISHQVRSEENEKERWRRLRNLTMLAMDVDMGAKEIGRENLEEVLRIALVGDKRNDQTVEWLDWIWKGLVSLTDGRPSRIPIEIRFAWLEWNSTRDRETALKAADFLVNNGAAHGSEEVLERILTSFASRIRLDDSHLVIGKIIDFWQRDIKLDPRFIVRVFRRMILNLKYQAPAIASAQADEIIDAIIDQRPGIDQALLQIFSSSLGKAKRQIFPPTPAEKISELVERNASSMKMVMYGINTLSTLTEDKNVRDTVESVIRLCEVVFGKRDIDVQPLISAVTNTLRRLNRSTPLLIQSSITAFTRIVIDTATLHRLSSEIISDVLKLNVLLPEMTEETYNHIRKIYPYARSSQPPQKWIHSNIDVWRRLFRQALKPPSTTQSHLHFAARLYADLQIDGMKMRRTDALAYIRAIARSDSSSRAILLERQLKDWQFASFGRKHALATALTEGLTMTINPDDALLALNLSERILQGLPIPKRVLLLAADRLSRSSQPRHYNQSIDLLQLLPDDPYLVNIYNRILGHLLIPSSKTYDISLSQAVEIYRTMGTRKLSPNLQSTTLFMRGLIESGRIDHALTAFRTITTAGMLIKSTVVGRLMVNLIVKDRLDEAEDVETIWRKLGSTKGSPLYDKGVIGARVLLDIKRGIEVDIAEVERKTGWKASDSFKRYLKSHISIPDGDKVADAMSALDTSEPAFTSVSSGYKQRIEPITHSLWDSSGQGWAVGSGWKPSREREKGTERENRERSVEMIGRVGLVGF